ncbi:MAG: hypothetical protein HZB38_05535 [Planctomycetes bacterium]|nr:hypothetical protein [Planctomycetota bacterium]
MTRFNPTDEQLAAYAAGEAGVDAAAIQQYLTVNPAVAAGVARLRTAINAMRTDRSVSAPAELIEAARTIFRPRIAAAGESWWARASRVIAELVFDSRNQPALAGYRASASAGFQLAYETEGGDVELQFEPGTGDANRWRVIGQVNREESSESVDIAVLSATDASLVRELRADDSGVFTLDLDAGDYDFCVNVADRVTVLSGVRVR